MSKFDQQARGFSLIEVMIALSLAVFGFFTFFSVFSSSSMQVTQSQNRTLANLLAQNFLEEFQAHTFGQPAPEHWELKEDRSFVMVVKGREKKFVFHRIIEYENGSFVGTSNGDQDLVTMTITWKEMVGKNQVVGNPTGFPEDNKMLKIQVPVWR